MISPQRFSAAVTDEQSDLAPMIDRLQPDVSEDVFDRRLKLFAAGILVFDKTIEIGFGQRVELTQVIVVEFLAEPLTFDKRQLVKNTYGGRIFAAIASTISFGPGGRATALPGLGRSLVFVPSRGFASSPICRKQIDCEGTPAWAAICPF